MPDVKIQRQLQIIDENDKWDMGATSANKVSAVSFLQRWDQKMRYRAAVAMAVTDDKARATGPFHSPKQ